ncbi:MAG: DUF5685 family protein [Eubacteriales bacterium]|nr:DUF5685 family protein [Eubacteriales bacterium]
MYGYVVVNKPELKFKEYDLYRSYYCGLCDVLKREYGFCGQMSISYDMTFLILLLSGLYEPKTSFYKGRCVAHPIVSHEYRRNEVSSYVADMNILMTYYKCMDDWEDEKKVTRRLIAGSLKKDIEKIRMKYTKKAAVIEKALKDLARAEKSDETNIDEVSAYFGNIMAVMTDMKEDIWSHDLQELGFWLGKFIYLLDAYEDLDEDLKNGRFNVFKSYYKQEGFDDLCRSILNSVMSKCARAFERLPIIQDAQILRNIIYSGVWTRFELVCAKRANKQKNRRIQSDGSI